MFARTRRLTLRPGWLEDGPALAAAMEHGDLAQALVRPPWPYHQTDAATFLALPSGPTTPRFVICDHVGATPRIVGGIGIREEAGEHQLAYWLTPAARGLGYATEAARAVVDMARHALPIERLHAWYFADDPASARVLRKLGFRDTGQRAPRVATVRPESREAVLAELDLDDRPAMPIAA